MTLRIGYDDNLGCPASVLADPAFACVPYHDLDQQLADLRSGETVATFAPAGALPYLDGLDVVLLAEAQVGHSPILEANLSVRRGFTWDVDAAGAGRVSLGAINTCCTTTYWASQIALMDRVPAGATLDLVQVDGFQDLFDRLDAGDIDAAFLWNQAALKQGARAGDLEVVLPLDGLPGPLVYGHPALSAQYRETVAQAFLSAPYQGPPAYFDLFGPPDRDAVARFVDQCRAAREVFGVLPIRPLSREATL